MKRFFFLLSAMFAPLLAGCGGPAVVDAGGVVRMRGQPLAKAVVVFSPKAGDAKAKAAVAITDDSGAFQLETTLDGTKTFPGAIPGEYTVTVSKIAPPAGMTEAKYQSLIDAEEARQQKMGYTGDSTVPPRVDIVPPEYSNTAKTKLTATVQASGNSFTFEIP